jgi:hypothetical protein
MQDNMEHFIKLIPTEKMTEEQKDNFVNIVKSVDPSINSYYEDGNHLILELSHSLSEEELDKIFQECNSTLGTENYFLMASDEDAAKDEEPIETIEESVEPKKEESKEEFKDIYQKMCDELEVKMHNRIIDKKSALGWKYSDKFDPHKKESPLMKPYHELPEEYRIKNGKIFNDVIDILKKNGFTVSSKKK